MSRGLLRDLSLLLAVCLATCPNAVAAESKRFAAAWPLALEREDSGVYRVAIDEAVYRQATDARLRDVAVLDAGNVLQPATLMAGTESNGDGLRWIEIEGASATEAHDAVVLFTLPGRFPIEQVQVLAAPNSSTRWQLESRERDSVRWRRHGTPRVAFHLIEDGEQVRSGTQPLDGITRDWLWRLRTDSPAPPLPRLRLGYREESLVFLAQGDPPYTLVAGSALTRRPEAALGELLAEQKQRHGPDWLATHARKGPETVRDGMVALQVPDAPVPTTRWLLWSLLVLGSLVVVGMAAAVLKSAIKRQP